MVVLPNVNVVNCVSASSNQIPGNREDLVGDSAVRIGSTNGGVQPGMLPDHGQDVNRARVDSRRYAGRLGFHRLLRNGFRLRSRRGRCRSRRRSSRRSFASGTLSALGSALRTACNNLTGLWIKLLAGALGTEDDLVLTDWIVTRTTNLEISYSRLFIEDGNLADFDRVFLGGCHEFCSKVSVHIIQ